MHSSISVQQLKGICLLLLMVQLISLVYPKGQSASLYRFDPDIFGENDWPKLKGMLSKVGCVSGCKLTTQYSYPSHSPSKQSQTRKATYSLSCTHAIKGRFSGSSKFNDDDIGPINVVTVKIVMSFYYEHSRLPYRGTIGSRRSAHAGESGLSPNTTNII